MHDLVTFSATSFSSGSPGATPPVDPVTGSFTITFDPTMTYTDQTAGIKLTGLNIPLDSSLAFNYSPAGPVADGLVVGGLADGVCCLTINPTSSSDFYLYVTTFTTSPTF